MTHASGLRTAVGLLLTAAVTIPAASHAQEAVQWHRLGWYPYDEITGRRDSVLKFVRAIGPDTYVLRTDYRTERGNAAGKPWRSSYLVAFIDCTKRTMQLVRTDYYANDSTFVASSPADLKLTAEMLVATDGLLAFYNFACTLRKD